MVEEGLTHASGTSIPGPAPIGFGRVSVGIAILLLILGGLAQASWCRVASAATPAVSDGQSNLLDSDGREAVSPGPVGVIALGHSGLTGENADPSHPGQVALEYSWATGTDSEVDSIYQRLVAARPETEGHVSNHAQGGAPSATLAAQAEGALREVPEPALAIIQTIDGDIRCDGTDDAHVPEFGRAVEAALDVITKASPETRILIVSQLGRPATDAMALSTDPAVTSLLRGEGICDFFDPDGAYRADRVAVLTAIIEAYESEQARVCAQVAQCIDDRGVLASDPRQAGFVSSDWSHLNVAGHAHVADLLWPLAAEVLGLPTNDQMGASAGALSIVDLGDSLAPADR